jgi:hypothetical protein
MMERFTFGKWLIIMLPDSNSINSDISNVLEQSSNVSIQQKMSIDLVASVSAHQCGVNNLLVGTNSNSNNCNSLCKFNLLISASDDQTIHICNFEVQKSSTSTSIEFLQLAFTSILACNTAITGLQYFDGLIFSCGSDQRLNVWEVSTSDKLDIIYKSGTFIEVPDVSCLLVVPQDNHYLCMITGYLALQTIKLIKS